MNTQHRATPTISEKSMQSKNGSPSKMHSTLVLACQQLKNHGRSPAPHLRKVSLALVILGEVLLGTWILAPTRAFAAPAAVNVCFKTNTELDLNQSWNVNTKAKLTNPAYFGTGGTVAPETLNFISLSSVTTTALNSNNCQIYFGGGNNGPADLSSSEISAVQTWLTTSGHFLLAGCDYADPTLGQVCSAFRTMTDIPNGGVTVNSILAYNPLTCGDTLSVGTYGGVSSYFTAQPSDSILATHSTGQTAALTDSLVTPKFLFSGDADMYGSSGASAIGSGATATSDQAKFVVNSFKFAVDAVKGRLVNPQCVASYDQKADLELGITTTNATPALGGQTTVTITVVNKGPNNVTGVTVGANLPTGLSLVSQTGTGSYSTSTQAWTVGNLNNGASASITLTLNVTSAGNLSIPAQIVKSSLADPDSATNAGFAIDDLEDGLADDDEATVSIISVASQITGTIFEDVNYGGGSGRNLTALGAVPRDGATVELYKNDGTYLSSTLTSGGGKYTFSNLATGDYYVRVVNNTVTSSRSGYNNTLIPVQTYRTNAGVTAGTVTAVTDRVGGEKPSVIDTGAATSGAVLNITNFTFTTGAGSATTGGQAESVTAVKVSNSDIAGIDFGYNFDTIVNTNDAGQGSLRQFIANSNALANTSLDQVANPSPAPGTTAIDPPAGTETSIFMIPSSSDPLGRTKDPNFNANTGVAEINLTSGLTITSTFTVIDAGTQTVNIGNTNSGKLGIGATATYRVGTGADGVENTGDEPILTGVEKPEVQISSNRTFQCLLINSSATDTGIKGLSIYGCTDAIGMANTTRVLIQGNILGASAINFTDPGVGIRNKDQGVGIWQSSYVNINNNLIGFNGGMGIWVLSTSNNITIQNNEVRNNAYEVNVGGQGLVFDGIEIQGSNNTVVGNLSTENFGNAIDNINGVTGNQFINNTLEYSGVGFIQGSNAYPEGSGIRVYGSDQIIKWNVIRNNRAPGILMMGNAQRNLITQNSFYNNSQLGIDLRSETTGFPATSAGTSPYVSANDGAVGTVANNGMDYPVITSAKLSSGTLSVKGFVGNLAAGSSTFANAVLEFFIAADDGDNNGGILAGDGKSKPHGEGKTYIGTCNANVNSLFNCSFANAGTLGLTDAKNITATATDSNGNTSEFSAIPNINANLLLVKRITAINGVAINTYTDDTTSPRAADDNHANWPTPLSSGISNFLRGAINAGQVKPGDEIEYTIYFLNAGENDAKNARICDRLLPNQTFKTGAYGVNQDLELKLGNSASQYLTSANDSADRTQLISANSTVTSDCNLKGANTNGTLAIDLTGSTGIPALTTLPGSTGAGSPNNSYGYIRFVTKVNP